MREKVLDINTGKSNFIIVGSSKVTRYLKEMLESKVIKLADNEINESEMEKYLGDYIHSLGNN